MNLFASLIHFVNSRSASRFEAATKDPCGVQTSKVMDIVTRNAGTEYGKKYGFDSINTVEEYQRQVPVITYEDIADDMERVTKGAKNVFTAEHPVMFAQTSGTTGKPKFIPVTPTDRGGPHKDIMRTWLWHARNTHPDMFDGKVMSMVSPAIEGYTPSGVPFGSTSGHVYQSVPWIVSRMYSIPYQVFEIADYVAKYYTIMRISLEHNVKYFATANPSSIIKMCEKANSSAEDIIRDIRDGTLNKSMNIEAPIRSAIESKLRPNPTHAKMLEEARARRNGDLLPGDFWPGLNFIGCWKGGTVGHYLDKFPGLFDPDGNKPVATRDQGYLSSECRGSVPLSDKGSAGVLTIASNFFEFVGVDDLEAKRDDSSAWTFLTADKLEEGKPYYIFVTTTSGLYRYDINDVIEVQGKYNQTPQIVFLRKGRGQTNITGEKLSVNQVIEAVQQASKDTGAIPAHFKAEADTDNSRYVLRVELANSMEVSGLKTFLTDFDSHLKHINIEYKAKRDSQRLGAPQLHVMREGWYERKRRQQVDEGKRAFQAKTELLSASKMATVEIRPDLDDVIEMD